MSVAANVVPRAMCALVSAAATGDLERTRRIQSALLPLFGALFCTTTPIPVNRASEMMGHARRALRLPLTAASLDDGMVSALKQALSTARAVAEDR